jgi:hypothetical protein
MQVVYASADRWRTADGDGEELKRGNQHKELKR